MNCAVYVETALPGSKLRPDFIRVHRNSQEVFVDVIEIESPRKKLFNADGTRPSLIQKARLALNEYERWFGESGNKERFLRDLLVTHEYLKPYVENQVASREFGCVAGVRGGGRRREVEANESGRRMRGQDKILEMTWDRIAPDHQGSNATICRDGGKVQVQYVPPYYPFEQNQGALVLYAGWDAAIKRSDLTTSERKALEQQLSLSRAKFTHASSSQLTRRPVGTSQRTPS